MRFLHEIEKLNENKLRRKISNKIKRLERKSKKNNPHITTIGYQVGFEPVLNDVSWDEDVIEITYQINDFYDDFIPENTRIVYGMMLNPFTGKARHDGKYYYMDDQEYLYDFCKFIQDKEIEDSYDFFGYLKDFLENILVLLKI